MKHVVSFYGADMSHLPRADPKWHNRYQELFATADLILCQGPYMATQIESMGCPPQKMLVHALGAPVDLIEFVPRMRKKEDPLRVLIAATFQEKKGIPDALRALCILQKRVQNIRITIIGDATQDRRSRLEKRHIMNTLRETGLFSVTRLMGYQPSQVLREEAYKHHVFLSPSRRSADGDSEGGAPISLIEMAATGMPIVSTKHADIPTVVKNGESALLAEEGNVEELSECLFRVAAHPGEWERMGAAGRLHVEREFNASLQGRKLARLYQTLI